MANIILQPTLRNVLCGEVTLPYHTKSLNALQAFDHMHNERTGYQYPVYYLQPTGLVGARNQCEIHIFLITVLILHPSQFQEDLQEMLIFGYSQSAACVRKSTRVPYFKPPAAKSTLPCSHPDFAACCLAESTVAYLYQDVIDMAWLNYYKNQYGDKPISKS